MIHILIKRNGINLQNKDKPHLITDLYILFILTHNRSAFEKRYSSKPFTQIAIAFDKHCCFLCHSIFLLQVTVTLDNWRSSWGAQFWAH